MRLLSLEWENFGSYYGVHQFVMEKRGLTLVRGKNLDEPRMDSNGSGKSTVFDALDWCWFGQSPRGSHAESMFNEEAFAERGAQCRVKVNMLNDADQPVMVERGRTKSKTWLKLTVGDDDLTTLDSKETQTNLEKVLGLDRETFHAAVLFAQGDLVHYADSGDADRMRILTRILQLEQLDKFLELAKAKLKTASESRASAERDVVTLGSRIEAMERVDFNVSIEQWEATRQAQLGDFRTKEGQLNTEFIDLQSQTQNLEVLIQRKNELDHALAAPYQADPALMKDLVAAKEALAQCDKAIAVDTAEANRLMGVWNKFGSMQEGVCSQCGQPVTREHLDAEITKAQTAQTEAAARAHAGQGIRMEWVARVETLENQSAEHRRAYDEDRAAKSREAGGLAATISGQQAQQRRMAQIQQELNHLQTQMAEVQARVNPNLEQKAKHDQELNQARDAQAKAKQILAAVDEQTKYLEFWVDGFGPQGLKSYILDSRLQELTDAANQWVRMLTGGTIWVRFESQKKKRKSTELVNAPDLRVFRWNPDGTVTERPYKDWSGGEKQRISFAVDFGLTRLIAQRASQSYNFLGLDEVFRHLDRAGKEAVMEMLQQLSLEKESLLVVEHDHEFQAQFENMVQVTKENRRSRLREVYHDQRQAQAHQDEVPAQGVPVGTDGKRRPVRTPVRRPVVAD